MGSNPCELNDFMKTFDKQHFVGEIFFNHKYELCVMTWVKPNTFMYRVFGEPFQYAAQERLYDYGQNS